MILCALFPVVAFKLKFKCFSTTHTTESLGQANVSHTRKILHSLISWVSVECNTCINVAVVGETVKVFFFRKAFYIF